MLCFLFSYAWISTKYFFKFPDVRNWWTLSSASLISECVLFSNIPSQGSFGHSLWMPFDDNLLLNCGKELPRYLEKEIKQISLFLSKILYLLKICLDNPKAGIYFSNETGGECFLSKGYCILNAGEFFKCKISLNSLYVGSHLVLVKKVFANAPNLST